MSKFHDLFAAMPIYVFDREGNQIRNPDIGVNREDLEEYVIGLEQEVTQLRDRLEKARTYTGLEAYPCPLCTYDKGVFVEACQMHKDQKKLSDQCDAHLEVIHKICTDISFMDTSTAVCRVKAKAANLINALGS